MKPLRNLVHKNGLQSLDRRREEIFAAFLVNPGQVTELNGFGFLVFILLEYAEMAFRMVWTVSLADDRIDARVSIEVLL